MDRAIAQVTSNRVKTLETRDREKAQKFTISWQMFHCQELSIYFFTSVAGTWDEKFLATVSLGSVIDETLPPFSFNP